MILKKTSLAIAVAVLILGTSAALTYAQSLGIIGFDAARRTMQVMIGLVLAMYSNLVPKDVGSWRSSAEAMARVQSALRVGGWSMTLAGLAYAGLWAFAPLAVAGVLSTAVVATALLITIGYSGAMVLVCRLHRSPANHASDSPMK